jgi:hypothetical protein
MIYQLVATMEAVAGPELTSPFAIDKNTYGALGRAEQTAREQSIAWACLGICLPQAYFNPDIRRHRLRIRKQRAAKGKR